MDLNSRIGEDISTATLAIARRAFLRHQDHCRACDTGTAVFEQQRQRQHGKMTMHDMPIYSVKQCSNVQGGSPLKLNKQTLFSLHLLGHENKGDKNQQNQDGSEDELEVSPQHTCQQCSQGLRH